MQSCCNKNISNKCIRNDGKIFKLPRKFTRKQCNKIRGFSMRSSCAPYKYCKILNGGYKTFRNKLIKNNKFKKSNKIKKINKSNKNKPQFLYNPDDPSKSFDVYIDKNPKDTISIKYKTLEDVKNTILKLEKLYKTNKYSHKRIWQVGMIMYVRLKVLKNKKPKEYKLSLKYFKFLGKRTNIKNDLERKKLLFKF